MKTKSLVEQYTDKRKSLGWSQRELAKRSGVPQAQISRIESGASDPRISTLEKLGLAMGVEPATRPALPPILRTFGAKNTRLNGTNYDPQLRELSIKAGGHFKEWHLDSRGNKS